MARFQVIELIDQAWLPKTLRDGVTTYLEWITDKLNMFQFSVPVIAKSLEKLGSHRIVDVCSGSGGPWRGLHSQVQNLAPESQITLSDLYPSTAAIEEVQGLGIKYDSTPRDACNMKLEGKLLRTQFFAFHHFSADLARKFLQDSVNCKHGICVFDGSSKGRIPGVITFPLIFLTALLSSPFWRPFKWKSFLLCVFPIIPLITTFDGVMSHLRFYSVAELKDLVCSIEGHESYDWEILDVKTKAGWLTQLVGIPKA